MDIYTVAKNNVGLKHKPLIFLDIESTGLQIQKHEIIEIGALKVNPQKPFEIEKELSIKVKPHRLDQADPQSLKVVGYTSQEWEDAVELKTALAKLDKFGHDGVLVGYNVSFDWAILDKAYFDLGRIDPFYYHRIDVMAIAYARLFKESQVKKFSLTEICKFLNIKPDIQHRALADAKTTHEIFKKLMSG